MSFLFHIVNEKSATYLSYTFRSFRFAGYKQYTWWVHNRLGKGVRKVIPSCAVWAIRNTYPAPDDTYVPFMESIEDEERNKIESD